MLPSGLLNTKYESDLAIVRTKTQWLLLALGLAFVFSLSALASDYWLIWLTELAIAIVVVLGLHILTGLCGQFSIGQAAFMGVGAYTTAVLTTRYGLNGWLCLPLAALSAGVVGLLFGLPCFKLKGFYLAISTLAASFIIIWVIDHSEGWTGGASGLAIERLRVAGIDFSSRRIFYCVAIVVMPVATFFAKNIQRTRAGRAFVAIRDNELAAQVSGVNLFRYKMLAFFIGCSYAGVAGWLWAYATLRVNPEQFGLYDSIWFVGMLIIGGIGSTMGVFFGAISFRLLERLIDYAAPPLAEAFPAIATQLHVGLSLGVFSIVLLLFLILEPRGLNYRWEKIKSYYRLYPYAYMRE
ncbi:MAG: branched-chain amino acid ABC transporter permease [Chloroflexi bacterium]|nr:branched-chain amino acid ABC transporter permease [Chloroflexota bacterium]